LHAELSHRYPEIEMLVVAASDDLGTALREQGEAGDLVADGVGGLCSIELKSAAVVARSPNGRTIHPRRMRSRLIQRGWWANSDS
jgi:hypothetical protein